MDKKFEIKLIGDKFVMNSLQDRTAIDIHNIETIKDSVKEKIDFKEDLYFDFSRVDYIDSSGLGGMIDIMKKLKANNKKVSIVSITEDVYMVFTHTKVEIYFDFFDTLDDTK